MVGGSPKRAAPRPAAWRPRPGRGGPDQYLREKPQGKSKVLQKLVVEAQKETFYFYSFPYFVKLKGAQQLLFTQLLAPTWTT